ncbi:MAG: hypothetical protein K1X28_06490 [Parachlamydiales bacterium]|nr:hypothetical protein [Parachlamydiales bacterium]
MTATLTAFCNRASTTLSGIGANLWKRTEGWRKRDNLIIGTQLAGLSGIAAAASWFLPYSYTARFVLSGLSYGMAKFYGGAEGAARVYFDYFPKAAALTCSAMKSPPKQGVTGAWQGADIDVTWSQFFDPRLAQEMGTLLQEKEVQSAWDFGCGSDAYSKALLKQKIRASGLDGNPQTPKLSGGTAEVQDLSVGFDREKRDCVISLEVGDKIPAEFAGQFLANVSNHALKTIVISWAVPGQKGSCHLNPKENDYVVQQLDGLGWELDVDASRRLRDASHPIYYWFQDSLMVFKKKEAQAQ